MIGLYFKLQRYSIHDGPGIRTSIFLCGCPLRCAWCHNPESQKASPARLLDRSKCVLCGKCADACGTGALTAAGYDPDRCTACRECVKACPNKAVDISGEFIDPAKLAALAARDSIFFDESGGGVTLTGGEPLYQAEFALELARELKSRGVNVALDTCGLAARDTFERALKLVDLFLYDIKAADAALHKALTGADNSIILENLRFLARSGANIWARLPLIPTLNDGEADLRARFALTLECGIKHVNLIPYHSAGAYKYGRLGADYALANIKAPDDEAIRRAREIAAGMGVDIIIGG